MKNRSHSESLQAVKRIRTSATADLRSAAFPSPTSSVTTGASQVCDDTAFSKSNGSFDSHYDFNSVSLPPLQIIPSWASKNFNDVNVNTPSTPNHTNLPALLIPSPSPSVRSIEDLLLPNRELANLLQKDDLYLPSCDYVKKILKKPHTRSSI